MRPRSLKNKVMRINFNPRTHVGCDDVGECCACALGISIHAPTWGATSGERYVCHFHRISIHAPTWGATGVLVSRLSGRPFQSTHPRGVRRSAPFSITQRSNFNPRTHVGCDLSIIFALSPNQHFNPRTHVGCDLSVIYVLKAELYFNPRTHVGCDKRM